MEYQFALAGKFLMAIVIGALVGLEREFLQDEQEEDSSQKNNSGIRTYIFISTLGAFGGYLSIQSPIYFSSILLVFSLVLLMQYYFLALKHPKIGITTILSKLFTFVICAILLKDNINPQLIFALVVLNTFILSQKQNLKLILQKLYGFETNALFSFLVIAIVILPFLPNHPIYFGNLPYLDILLLNSTGVWSKFVKVEFINLYKMWTLIVLVVAIDFLGYFLSKLFGRKHGMLLSAIAGGIASSTATIMSLTSRSKEMSGNNSLNLVAPAIIANGVSIIPLMLLIMVSNMSFFLVIYPYLVFLLLISLLVGVWFLKSSTAGDLIDGQSSKNEVFSLYPALKFGIIFTFVKLMLQSANILWGDTGILIGSMLAAITGMDALTVGLSVIAGKSTSLEQAGLIFLLANAVNFVSLKGGIALVRGGRSYGVRVFMILITFAVTSIILYVSQNFYGKIF